MGLSLEEMAAKLSGVEWKSDHKSFTAQCPFDASHILGASRLIQACRSKCPSDKLKQFFANGTTTNGKHTPDSSSGRTSAFEAEKRGSNPRSGANGTNGHANGNGYHPPATRNINAEDILRRVPPQNLEAEQSVLGAILIDNPSIEEANRILKPDDFYRESHRLIFTAMQTLWRNRIAIDVRILAAELNKKPDQFEQVGGYPYLAELAADVPSASNIVHYANIVRAKAISRRLATAATSIASMAYEGVTTDALLGEAARVFNPIVEAGSIREPIPWEGLEAAVAANEEYLKREPIVDKLLYSHAVSMITGGKHAGKSTLARWLAICVEKGWDFLGRSVRQGPVFYIASEDETMAARQELIRLGWKQGDELRFLSAKNIRSDKPEIFLSDLTTEIRRSGCVLVILDMLFDFVRIDDEMSYAGTRQAVGLIQEVASASGAHLNVLHHAPKNAMIGDAAVAALGSQGLAARVSPIILVRRFGPGVHSISSTSVRDPRGEAVIESRLIREKDGSVVLGGAFKNYMLAEVYADRVLAFLNDDPESEATRLDVAEALDIAPAVARGCLAVLYKQGVIARVGDGKKGKPFRFQALLTKTSAANDQSDETEKGTGVGTVPNSEERENELNFEAEGRFGYKEN